MLGLRHLHLKISARPSRPLRPFPRATRSYVTSPHSQRGSSKEKTGDDNDDFRPPWVYTASHFLTYTTIPIALIYCVFLADWGDRDHVFMPIRRWALQYKQSFFSLSPEERALVQQRSGSEATKESSAERVEGSTGKS